jgi:chromate transporter
VVGVILNLSLWFGLHVLFGTVTRRAGWFRPWVPDWAGFDPLALLLCVVAAVALLRFHVGVVTTLGLCAALGLLVRLI